MPGRCSAAWLALLLCRGAGAQAPAVLRRIPAEGPWDVVVRAAPPATADGRFVWSPAQPLEVAFEDRSDPHQSIRIVSEPGPNNDCYARIERITASALVVSCIGEKWSTYESHEFVYDAHSRALLRHIAYTPWGAAAARQDGIVMTDAKAFLRVTVDAAGQPHLARAAAPPPAAAADALFGTLRLSGRAAIAGDGKTYPLPQSDTATWHKARPDDRERGQSDGRDIDEEIGPHQWVDGRLWFGKTFYNGEGLSGVGGFGYFDTALRAFQLFAPREIWRWSVSAMLVEADAVWLALYRRGEYGNTPGGLARWDRQTRQVRQFAMDQVGVAIARLGGVLSSSIPSAATTG